MKRYFLRLAKIINSLLGRFGFTITSSPSPSSKKVRPYSHVRILSFARHGYFSDLATYIQIDEASFSQDLNLGVDFLIYEPGAASKQPKPEELAGFTTEARRNGIKCVLLIGDGSPPVYQEVKNQFDLTLRVGAKQEGNKDELHQYYSLDPRVDNPIGLDFSARKKRILLPYDADSRQEPKLELPFKQSYLPLNNVDDSYSPQPIDKGMVNNTWAAILLRKCFGSDQAYAATAMRLAANGMRVVADNTALLPAKLQKGIIPQVSVERIDQELNELLPNLESWEQMGVLQTRTALGRHSRINTFEELLGKLDIGLNEQPLISVLAVTKRPELANRMLDNVAKQRGVRLEIFLCLHGATKTKLREVEKLVSTYKRHEIAVSAASSDVPLGKVLRDLSSRCSGEFIAKMDDDDYYGKNHLYDLLVAHSYSDAAIVGKWSNFVWFEDQKELVNWRVDKQEKYVPHLPGATWLARAELIKKYKFSSVKSGVDSTLLDRLRADKHKLYSTHRFNFVRSRHSDHTYNAGNDKFLKESDGRTYSALDKEIYSV